MNKEQISSKSVSTVFFPGDSTNEDLAIISSDFQGDVVVCGDLMLQDDLSISCRLWVMGNIYSAKNSRNMFLIRDYITGKGNLSVDGDVFCYGYINCGNIAVTGTLYCYVGTCTEGNIRCENFTTYGVSHIGGNMETKCLRISGGDVYVFGNIVSDSIIMESIKENITENEIVEKNSNLVAKAIKSQIMEIRKLE